MCFYSLCYRNGTIWNRARASIYYVHKIDRHSENVIFSFFFFWKAKNTVNTKCKCCKYFYLYVNVEFIFDTCRLLFCFNRFERCDEHLHNVYLKHTHTYTVHCTLEFLYNILTMDRLLFWNFPFFFFSSLLLPVSFGTFKNIL